MSGAVRADGPGLVTTGDCYSAAYANAMVNLGLDWVVLGDRWGYTWLPDAREPLGDIRLTPLDLATALVEWFPVRVREMRFRDGAACLAWLTAEQDRVAILAVDSVGLAHSAHHRVSHFPHAVAVRATASGGLTMADGYRGASFAGPVASGELEPALEGMRQFSHRHRTLQREHVELDEDELLALEIVPDAAAAEPSAAAMLKRLELSCRTHLQPTVMQLDAQYTNGRGAMIAAADALLAMPQSDMREEQIHYVMSCFASIASQRSLNAAFIEQASVQAGQPSLATCAEGFRRAGRQWITLRNTVYLRGSKGDSVQDRCAARMHKLAEVDHQLALDLRHKLAACR